MMNRFLSVLCSALAVAGCAKTATTSAPPAVHGAKTNTAPADVAHGKAIFAANCAQCHGANAQGGGVGPSLINEKRRKNTAQAITWIKNPQPPMPKLYPGQLSEKDVADVAAYVESL